MQTVYKHTLGLGTLCVTSVHFVPDTAEQLFLKTAHGIGPANPHFTDEQTEAHDFSVAAQPVWAGASLPLESLLSTFIRFLDSPVVFLRLCVQRDQPGLLLGCRFCTPRSGLGPPGDGTAAALDGVNNCSSSSLLLCSGLGAVSAAWRAGPHGRPCLRQ